MKKIISALLVLVMLFGCVLALTSCSKPELDFDKAKANLEAAGYTVVVNDEASQPGVEKMLMASTGDVGYDEGDYIYIYTCDNRKTAKLVCEMYELQKKQGVESLKYLIEYTEHIIKKYGDELSAEDLTEYEEELESYKTGLEDAEKMFVVGRSGKTVWYGTQAAIDATRGK